MRDQVRLLFRELVDLPPSERERVFRDRGVGADVRAEVESLLSFDASGDHLLTERVAGAAHDLLSSVTEREGTHCGAYRLVRLLGSGGMGAVYLAERADGEIRHQVAVKLLGLHGHRAGWRERFLNERQLLASLNHPSIVQVIDAGHTLDNQPYLVMEYVKGTPIDAYAARIGVRARLALFVRVCEAVSHAHHHLVIHRDLKPSNILVDASGLPKLLDFGIARLLDETSDATETQERLATPGYASPEQLLGLRQTTATDVYSLGAVLHELLTGTTPRRSAPGGPRTEIARPSRVNRDVPRDLDFILQKALRDEPQARYPSAEAFAADVRAVLESRPVAARSGNAWYRTRKFLRRHWVPAAAALLVLASLSTGLYAANRARLLAERRFSELRQLSTKVFDLDQAIRGLPGAIEARERLVSTSLEYLEGLGANARGDLDLAQEMADAYLHVARIQGVPTGQDLGHFDQAEASLKKADTLTEAVLTARPRDPAALYRSARIAHDRMVLAASEQRSEDSLAFADRAARQLEAFLQTRAPTQDERDDISMIYCNISVAYRSRHRYADSAHYARQGADVGRALPAGNRRIGPALGMLANALRDEGDLEGALQAITEARKLAEDAPTRDATSRMIRLHGVLLRQGLLLDDDDGVSLGRPAEAVEPLQRALDISEEAARQSPHDFASRGRVGATAGALGVVLRHRDPRRALEVCDLGIRRLAEVPSNLTARRDRAELLASSAEVLLVLHRPSEARQRIEESLAIFQAAHDYPAERIGTDSGLVTALRALADYHAARGDARRATVVYEDLLQRVMASRPDPLNDLPDATRLSILYRSLLDLYRRTGDRGKTEAMTARLLELWRHWERKLPGNAFVRRQLDALMPPPRGPSRRT